MEQFMSYQVGMAMKEFLILSLFGEIQEDYWNPYSGISIFLDKPSSTVMNIDLLIRELTHEEEGRRLPIEHLQKLLPYIMRSNESFMEELDKMFPLSAEINEEIEQIKKLLLNAEKLQGAAFLAKANPLFNAVSKRAPAEPRLTWYAEKLGAKCYNECSKQYWAQLSHKLESVLLIKDWAKATWYRKLAHIISFGYFRVPQVTDITEINTVDENTLLAKDWAKAPWYRKLAHIVSFGYFRVPKVTDVNEANVVEPNDPEFRSHLPQLDFLSPSAMNHLGSTKADHLREYLRFILTPQASTSSGLIDTTNTASKKSKKKSLTPAPKDSPASTCSTTSSKDDIDTGTLVIIETSNPGTVVIKEESNPGTVVIKEESNPGTVVIKEESNPGTVVIKKESTPGTVIIHKEKQVDEKAFFDKAKQDDPKASVGKGWLKRKARRMGSLVTKGEYGPNFFVTPPEIKVPPKAGNAPVDDQALDNQGHKLKGK